MLVKRVDTSQNAKL